MTGGRLYRDQLALSERHLDTLLSDTTSALDLLATLSESFKAVESETTAFQSQCEDLLGEQKRLRDLADEIGTELQYYAYLELLTRRLNNPGATRLIRGDDFLDMLINLNACIDFMDKHVSRHILDTLAICSIHRCPFKPYVEVMLTSKLAWLSRFERLQDPLPVSSRESLESGSIVCFFFFTRGIDREFQTASDQRKYGHGGVYSVVWQVRNNCQ